MVTTWIIVITVQLYRMAHKRSSSSLDDHASKPNRFARTAISVATDALLSANARIVELEHRVQALHAFINAKGLMRGKCPYAVSPNVA